MLRNTPESMRGILIVGRSFGVIEIGSSSVRLKILQVSGTSRKVVHSDRHPVRLGLSMLSNRGRLDPSAIQPALEVLTAFREEMIRAGVETYHVVAGAVLREATNPDDLLGPVRDQVGLHVQVLSGADEARLLFQALPRHDPATVPTIPAASVSGPEEPLVTAMVELGDHSLQYACGVIPDAQVAGSVPLGAGQLAVSHQTHLPMDLAGLARLDETIRSGLSAVMERIAALSPNRVVAAGGVLGSLPRAARHTSRLPYRVTLVQARGLVARLGRINMAGRVALGIKEDRAATLVVGAATAAVVLDQLHQESLWSVDASVRDGVLAELTRDMRPATV